MSQDRVHITAVQPRGGPTLWAELEGDDTLAGGVGGWEPIARPRTVPALEWGGTPGLTLMLPLLLDGTGDGQATSVEPDCVLLSRWGQKYRRTGQPAVLRVTGPVRVTRDQRWVIQDLEWGVQIRDDRGRRTQQQVIVSLAEYAEAKVYRSPARKARDRNKGRRRDRGRGR